MHAGVVAGELQRDRIGVAAHDRGVLRVELARRLGQARLAAGDAGPLGREGDFELGLARDRAQAAGDRALERLGRRFLGGRVFGLMLEDMIVLELRYPLPWGEVATKRPGEGLVAHRDPPLTRPIARWIGHPLNGEGLSAGNVQLSATFTELSGSS